MSLHALFLCQYVEHSKGATGLWNEGTCGAMDNASAYGAEDSRFESWQVRMSFSVPNRCVDC